MYLGGVEVVPAICEAPRAFPLFVVAIVVAIVLPFVRMLEVVC
jgi:hypothetical protein